MVIKRGGKIIKTYWIKQFIVIAFLIVLAFVIDLYMNNSPIAINNNIIKQLIFVIVISIILFALNQLIYNFAKINSDFMQHRIWNKMHIIIFIWLIISFTIFIILFVTTPLPDIIQNQLWVLYLIIYYFLFFMNVMILSIVNISVSKTTDVKRKIITTWLISTLVVALILFFIPSF